MMLNDQPNFSQRRVCDEYTLQDELRSVMLSLGQPLSDQQLRDMIAYADLDGDGKINLKEFIKIMTTDTKLVRAGVNLIVQHMEPYFNV